MNGYTGKILRVDLLAFCPGGLPDFAANPAVLDHRQRWDPKERAMKTLTC